MTFFSKICAGREKIEDALTYTICHDARDEVSDISSTYVSGRTKSWYWTEIKAPVWDRLAIPMRQMIMDYGKMT